MNERRKTLGADPGPADDLGTGNFQPRPMAWPDPGVARRVEEEGGYAKPAPTIAAGDTQRCHRAGRTVQLNGKVTPQNRARFQGLAEATCVSLNVNVERALDALNREAKS